MDKSILYWWHKPNAIEGRFDRDAQLKEAIEQVKRAQRLFDSLEEKDEKVS